MAYVSSSTRDTRAEGAGGGTEDVIRAALTAVSGRLFRSCIPMIPERPLPPRNASLIVTAGAEPEDVGVVDVDEDRDLRTAGLSSQPALAAPCRRIFELGGPGDELRSGVEEPLRLRRKRRHRAVRQQDMPQIDAPGVDHAHRSERNRLRNLILRSTVCISCRCRRGAGRCGRRGSSRVHRAQTAAFGRPSTLLSGPTGQN